MLFDEKFLYETLDGIRAGGFVRPLPPFIKGNLKHELRDYQRAALENFIAYFENERMRKRPTQVLFHMATGSGKTMIMAALMIYLYRRGYRNFLFFVHLKNILDKTKTNFIERGSSKYLFADTVTIDGERIPIRAVDNFSDADEHAINISFTSIQQLNSLFNETRENAMTIEDFRQYKLVLISDEAHHLNVETKGKKDDESRQTWEATVKNIFEPNADNVLLEFTATCDLANPKIRAEYLDKIVYDYPLTKFYRDGWSKDIVAFKADVEIAERELMACVLSQYRKRVFAAHGLNVKPIILFKSRLVKDSQNNMKAFIEMMRNLSGERLRRLSELNSERLTAAFEYFERLGVTMEQLATELSVEFEEYRCISTNDSNDLSMLNNLEQADNPYRAIFEVNKLDEGWDVLNLFDIVRLYETRQSGGKKISPTTISEAQLIGRGARYYPFALDDEQPMYRRKFDGDLDNEMRACEVLYYHCQNDRRYIAELKQALREIGLELEETTEFQYKLKEDFKRERAYLEGTVLVNKRQEDSVTDFREIFRAAVDKIYVFEETSGAVGEEALLKEELQLDGDVELRRMRLKFENAAGKNYSVIHSALSKYPVFRFDRLSLKFEGLSSTREFITSEKYLGGVTVDIRARAFDGVTMYRAAVDVLKQIAEALSKEEIKYKGSREFRAEPIHRMFVDKTIRMSKDSPLEPIELSASDDWFVYEAGMGTSEEHAFIEYMRDRIGALRSVYEKIFVIRNERALKVYDFDEGRRFEPDYVLLLRRHDGSEDQLQVFAEPKGGHLIEHDDWKEKFLLELESECGGRVIGLPFFNEKDDRKKAFDAAFQRLIGG